MLTPMCLHIRRNELFYHEDCGFNTPNQLKLKHIEHKHLYISFSNTPYKTLTYHTQPNQQIKYYTPHDFQNCKCIHQINKWLCAKKYNTCSVGVCAWAQRTFYMGTKENDNLNFNLCISSTKKHWPTYYTYLLYLHWIICFEWTLHYLQFLYNS